MLINKAEDAKIDGDKWRGEADRVLSVQDQELEAMKKEMDARMDAVDKKMDAMDEKMDLILQQLTGSGAKPKAKTREASGDDDTTFGF